MHVLLAKVVEAHRRSRRIYGAPRVIRGLRAQGLRTSKRRCARLFKALGLQGRRRGRAKPRTTDSRHGEGRGVQSLGAAAGSDRTRSGVGD